MMITLFVKSTDWISLTPDDPFWWSEWLIIDTKGKLPQTHRKLKALNSESFLAKNYGWGHWYMELMEWNRLTSPRQIKKQKPWNFWPMSFQSILKGLWLWDIKDPWSPNLAPKSGWECCSATWERIHSNAFFGCVPGGKWKRKNF